MWLQCAGPGPRKAVLASAGTGLRGRYLLNRDSNRVEVFEMVDSVADLHWLPTPSSGVQGAVGPSFSGSCTRCFVLFVTDCGVVLCH